MTESDPAAHPTMKMVRFEPLGINPHGLPVISLSTLGHFAISSGISQDFSEFLRTLAGFLKS